MRQNRDTALVRRYSEEKMLIRDNSSTLKREPSILATKPTPSDSTTASRCQAVLRDILAVTAIIFVLAAFASEYNLLEEEYISTSWLRERSSNGTKLSISASTSVSPNLRGPSSGDHRFKVTVGLKLESEIDNKPKKDSLIEIYGKVPLKDPLVAGLGDQQRRKDEDDELAKHSDNELYKYLRSVGYPHLFTLLIWDESGKLARSSPVSIQGWFPHRAHKSYDKTLPSKYGRVALLLNTNVLDGIEWRRKPPVPILSYTLPNEVIGNTSKNNGYYHLMPTPYDRDGYTRACVEHAEINQTPFEKKKNVIIWRGSSHFISNRLKLLDMAKKQDPGKLWLDAASPSLDPSTHMERSEQAGYKYQLDIGGASGTAWESLRWKMCSGGLVFKVNSWSQDWWHNTIEPWKHYVPVKKDLTDLREKYDWAEKNPSAVYEIVKRGRAVCKQSLTESSVALYQRTVLQSLPDANDKLIAEATEVLNGLGSFWKDISIQTSFNRTKMEEQHLYHHKQIKNGTSLSLHLSIKGQQRNDGTVSAFSSEKKRPKVPSSSLVPAGATPSTSIVRYLEHLAFPHMLTLLKWNPKGELDSVSPIDVLDLLPKRELSKYFSHTKPSTHGTVAFLLNTASIEAIDWNTLPPIPLIAYSLPNSVSVADKSNKFVLAPNPYDRTSFNRACISHAEQVTSRIPFQERKNVIIWRGTVHGEVDANRYKLIELSDDDPQHEWLDAADVEADKNKYMQRDAMSKYKYQLDIAGESGTTWGGLRWKMCSGNLVFKVDGWAHDWWHNSIEPWEHYVPVKADLSDLREKYEWAESNPEKVQQIVQRGTETCKSSVTEDVVKNYQLSMMMQSLQPATEALIKEATAILTDGLGAFYEPILNRTRTNV